MFIYFNNLWLFSHLQKCWGILSKSEFSSFNENWVLYQSLSELSGWKWAETQIQSSETSAWGEVFAWCGLVHLKITDFTVHLFWNVWFSPVGFSKVWHIVSDYVMMFFGQIWKLSYQVTRNLIPNLHLHVTYFVFLVLFLFLLLYSNSSLTAKSIFSTVNLLTGRSHAVNDMDASLTINPLSLVTLSTFNVWKVPGLIEHMFTIALMAEKKIIQCYWFSPAVTEDGSLLGMLNIMLVTHRPHGLDSHCSPFLALWFVCTCART